MPHDIRRASGQDAPALNALMHASSAYQGDYASILDGYEVTPEYVGRHQVFAAVPVLGPDFGPPQGFYSLTDAELDLLFVADTAQGTGLGAALIAHMLETARANEIPSVRVVSHPPAARFYERMGARRVGTVPPRPPKIPWARPELTFDTGVV
ncbi:GNAT family N-acetyltransferase [Amycolatopsis sp. NBC_00345]|uniref:GNAT family N-acetyltransferase n=1 Tax=Amycolatopsis sp. NBC_00345 TaxID=2975955 RepID=UPI002E25CCF2